MGKIKRGIEKFLNIYTLKKERVSYNTDLTICGRIFVQNSKTGTISIGNNVVINSSVEDNPVAGMKTRICTRGDGTVNIGNNVGMSNVSIYSSKCIVIKNDALIGAGTGIYDTDFHPVNYQERIEKREPLTNKIVISEGVFIGANTIILKGVTIGEHSVIGAGSVVTKSVPAGEIWAGNPAKFIRKIESE